ncbi:hypothetical protein D3C80_1461220 [compost metagenome]
MAERQRTVYHHPAAAADRQQIGSADGDINRRIKTGVYPRHMHVFGTGLRGHFGKLVGLMIFQAECLDHADAGHAFLSLIVQAGERRLRRFKALMQLIAVILDNDRHDGHRDQR